MPFPTTCLLMELVLLLRWVMEGLLLEGEDEGRKTPVPGLEPKRGEPGDMDWWCWCTGEPRRGDPGATGCHCCCCCCWAACAWGAWGAWCPWWACMPTG